MKPVVLGGARNPKSLWGRFIQLILNFHSPSMGMIGQCWCRPCRKLRSNDD